MSEIEIREGVLSSMRSELDVDSWRDNESWVGGLKERIKKHALGRHQMIGSLCKNTYSLPDLQVIHLEYRHAIVQVFTDALLMAQFQTRQLEPRLRPGAKMAPRFLLTLNTLDEFGFRPNVDSHGYYMGDAKAAHYELYEALMGEMGVTCDDRAAYPASSIASKVRTFLESSFGDYAAILALLAVAEEQVILFSPPLRQAVAKVGVDTGRGYYYVHGTTEDGDANAADDDHEDDLWFALTQAITPADYQRVTDLAVQYCDLWGDFWDHQQASVRVLEATS